jgi:hypothetical protein
MSRALVGAIPRGMADHRSKAGRVYSAYLRDKLARLGPLPADARPLLREAGRLVLDLERLRAEQDAAMARRRLAVARKVDRRLTPIRGQLLAIEERLEAMATKARKPRTAADLLAQIKRDSA